MKFSRWCAYAGLFVGVLRLIEYCVFGDLHHGYALAWAIHALVSGVLILWLDKREESQNRLTW